MAYVCIESYTEVVDGRLWTKHSWTIGGPDVKVPFDRSIQQVAGPFNGLAECDRWIETEGVKISKGKKRGEGGWY